MAPYNFGNGMLPSMSDSWDPQPEKGLWNCFQRIWMESDMLVEITGAACKLLILIISYQL